MGRVTLPPPGLKRFRWIVSTGGASASRKRFSALTSFLHLQRQHGIQKSKNSLFTLVLVRTSKVVDGNKVFQGVLNGRGFPDVYAEIEVRVIRVRVGAALHARYAGEELATPESINPCCLLNRHRELARSSAHYDPANLPSTSQRRGLEGIRGETEEFLSILLTTDP
jgi:hypothetical protein